MAKTENNNEEKREPKVLTMEEPIEFNSISESVYIKSTKFCQLVSNVFKQVFADFEGSRLDPDPTTNLPTLTLVFNHLEKPDSTLPYACTKDVDTKTVNETIRRLRNYTNRLYYGDAYHMTDDGKDMLEQFIMNIPRTRDKHGDVKWNDIITNVADGAQNVRNQQFTTLSFLDINLVAKFLYGATSVTILDPDGDPEDPNNQKKTHWIYTVKVMRSIPGAMSAMQGQVMHRDFVLKIERVREEEVTEIAQQLGFGMNANGLDIVRAAF